MRDVAVSRALSTIYRSAKTLAGRRGRSAEAYWMCMARRRWFRCRAFWEAA